LYTENNNGRYRRGRFPNRYGKSVCAGQREIGFPYKKIKRMCKELKKKLYNTIPNLYIVEKEKN
jgi:hypothetical protein